MADTEDTETLAQAMCHEQGGSWTFIRQTRRDTYLRNARAVLASSWLLARDERIRADEREKLAAGVVAAFDPGELECARLGLPCSSVNPSDRWCRACRINGALAGEVEAR